MAKYKAKVTYLGLDDSENFNSMEEMENFSPPENAVDVERHNFYNN